MGEKGLAAMEKLPKGYYAPAPGSRVPGTRGDGPGTSTEAGQAFPDDGRPGYPISWDDSHGTWRPPGFNSDPTDPDRLFNSATGQNAVWDDKAGGYIDSQTGKPIGYEQ